MVYNHSYHSWITTSFEGQIKSISLKLVTPRHYLEIIPSFTHLHRLWPATECTKQGFKYLAIVVAVTIESFTSPLSLYIHLRRCPNEYYRPRCSTLGDLQARNSNINKHLYLCLVLLACFSDSIKTRLYIQRVKSRRWHSTAFDDVTEVLDSNKLRTLPLVFAVELSMMIVFIIHRAEEA